MFGRKKMYKKGLADAMAANQGFMEKQQAAIEHMRQEIREGKDSIQALRDMLQDEVGNIYSFLNAREKAALYKLASPFDIKELGAEEKQLLVAILYQLADDEGDALTDAQRTYIRSVQQYLEIRNPQTSAELQAVENIDSLETQKAFMQVVLEFFYLQEADELSDQQEEFLSFFSLNRRQAEAIEMIVSQVYNTIGPEGLAIHYGPAPAETAVPVGGGEEKQKVFPFGSLNGMVAGMKMFTSQAHAAVEQEATGGEGKSISAGCEQPFDPSQMEEITLSQKTEIAKGEQTVYQNKIIHFRAKIECKGSLLFENCMLHYGEGGNSEIDIEEGGALQMKNCRIEDHWRRGSNDQKHFVCAKPGSEPIIIEACHFVNASLFLSIEDTSFSHQKGVVMRRCTFLNLGSNFIGNHNEGSLTLTDCRFSFPNWSQETQNENIINCHRAELTRCVVTGDLGIGSLKEAEDVNRASSDYYFLNASGKITQCSFRGMRNLIRRSMSITRTTFDHCSIGFPGHIGGGQQINMSDCRIEHSTNLGCLGDESKITHCQFNDCYQRLFVCEVGVKISRCEFNNWEGSSCLLRIDDVYDEDDASEISDCVFNGIRAGDDFVIRAGALEKISGYAVTVKGCRFMNCTTECSGGKMIQMRDVYYGKFSREKEQLVTRESDNTGLDDVNSGSGHNDNVQRMMTTAAGEPIGVELALPQD